MLINTKGICSFEYNNEIQQYDNFDCSVVFDGTIRSQDGGGHGLYEFYWNILYDKDNKQLVQPYGYESDRYIPKTIKDIITELTK